MDKWGYNYLIEKKTLWEKEKLLVMSNFSFSHNVFKSCQLLMRQTQYLRSKGLNWENKPPKGTIHVHVSKRVECLKIESVHGLFGFVRI